MVGSCMQWLMYLRAVGKLGHEGDVIGGPGLIGEAGCWTGLQF